MNSIDLNCDMGELPEAFADGSQEALLPFLSSVIVACGGHAGDPQIMRGTMQQALNHRVAIGAHPGYEDPANFGREPLPLSLQEIANSVYRQVLALDKNANTLHATVTHVKAHGALYHQAARDRQVAGAFAEGVRRWNPHTVLLGLAGSSMLDEFRATGFAVAAEAFADRRYNPDGTLRSRQFPNAVISDPATAARQALQIVQSGSVTSADGTKVPITAQTICLHSDTPGALAIVSAVHRVLKDAGITIAPLR